jgi:hypothetical protein
MTETAQRLKMSVAKAREVAKEHNYLCVSFGSKSVRIIEEKLNRFIPDNTGKRVLTPKPKA